MHDKPLIPIILLAAGQSSRMRGRDKLLEQVGGTPLLRRMALMACEAAQGPVLVALPDAPHPRHDALDGLDVVRLETGTSAEGMGGSIRESIRALPQGADAAMILLCDLPDLTGADLSRVLAAFDPDADTRIWRGATQDGTPGHPILFHRDLFVELADLSGDDGGRAVVHAHRDRLALVPLPGLRAHHDLDTPEDWAEWRATHPKS